MLQAGSALVGARCCALSTHRARIEKMIAALASCACTTGCDRPAPASRRDLRRNNPQRAGFFPHRDGYTDEMRGDELRRSNAAIRLGSASTTAGVPQRGAGELGVRTPRDPGVHPAGRADLERRNRELQREDARRAIELALVAQRDGAAHTIIRLRTCPAGC